MGPGPLNLIEVDAKLLGLLLRGLRGVRLLTALLTTGRLLRRLLALLRHLLPLLGGLSRRILGLSGRLTRGVLHALGGLAYLVRDPTEGTSSALLLAATGQATNGVLRLLCRLACSVLHLSRYLTGLVGCLACHLLSLACRLPRCVLRLLSRTLREVHHLLLRALGRFVHLILDTLVLGRLVYGPLELHVVVGHLLDLRLGIAFGELLGVLLELFTVVLDLALQAANGPRVEVLRALLRQLLELLLKVQALGHAMPFLRSLFCSQRGRA